MSNLDFQGCLIILTFSRFQGWMGRLNFLKSPFCLIDIVTIRSTIKLSLYVYLPIFLSFILSATLYLFISLLLSLNHLSNYLSLPFVWVYRPHNDAVEKQPAYYSPSSTSSALFYTLLFPIISKAVILSEAPGALISGRKPLLPSSF